VVLTKVRIVGFLCLITGDRMMNVQEMMAIESQRTGINIKDCGNNHFQILGKILVNYYPKSKCKTAYISATNAGLKNISIKQAFELSQNVPSGLETTKRKSCYRKIRERMFNKTNKCYWCECKLTLNNSTVDHVIPLSKGGLDHSNNRVLACEPCNKARGNWMPELTLGCPQAL